MLDLGGPSLGHVAMYCKRPSLLFLKAAARKLAEGLTALHAAGVCHGGKYCSPNIYGTLSAH